MKVCVADQKKRIVLPGASPGDVFQLREKEPGHLELLLLLPMEASSSNTREKLLASWNQFSLTPRCSWEELRKVTREDF